MPHAAHLHTLKIDAPTTLGRQRGRPGTKSANNTEQPGSVAEAVINAAFVDNYINSEWPSAR